MPGPTLAPVHAATRRVLDGPVDAAALVPLLRRPGEPFVFLDPAGGAGWGDAILAPVQAPLLRDAPIGGLAARAPGASWLVAATYDHGRARAGVETRHGARWPGTLAARLDAWVRVTQDGRASIEGSDPAAVARLGSRLVHPRPYAGAPPRTGPVSALTSRAEYAEAVRTAHDAIRRGESYQVNLSLRLEAPWRGDPWPAYEAMRRRNPSPYGAFVDLGPDGPALCCNSPELLLRAEGEALETRPIAGTRPRGAGPDEDAALMRELAAHAKERAEHVMLVDLARNDLGRVAAHGSVRVSKLGAIERYSHVMHLVSRVEARLKPGASAADAFDAVFPAGTISGAPKQRTMELIDEIEPVARGHYTGALALVGPGALHANILIRTLVVANGAAHAQVGAGIVADSDPHAEHAECLAKAGALVAALEAFA